MNSHLKRSESIREVIQTISDLKEADTLSKTSSPEIREIPLLKAKFESPDVENLPIMKIILNNEKFMR